MLRKMLFFVVLFGLLAWLLGPPAILAGAPAAAAVSSRPIFFYERTFGDSDTPYLADTAHLYLPAGLSVDGAGNLWVAEALGARVLKYAGDGSFMMSIGAAGITARPDETHFNAPTDAAVDAGGNVWVADNESHRVVKYDAAGDFLMQLGVTGEAGTDGAHFDWPVSIAFNSAGDIYVSDFHNHRIQVFDDTGFYKDQSIGQTGVSGSDNAHFNSPARLAIDADDNIYVPDLFNHRVQIFDSNHVHVATLGVSTVPGSDNDHLDSPRGVAVDAARIYVADGGNHRVQVFDRVTRTYLATLGTGWGSGTYQFDTPADVAIDSGGNVYVADAQNHRVQKFNSSLEYVRTFGDTGVPYLTDGYHYNQPVDIAVADSGKIAIIEDWGRGQRLIVLDAAGVPQFTVGEAGVFGSDNDHFNDPRGVAFDSSGKLYVAECGNHRVQIFSSEGVWGARLGTGSGPGNDEFSCPSGVAVDGSGNIYVADADNHRIQIFDQDRIYLATLGVTGTSGSDNGHFNWPNDVEVDAAGDVYVADTFNHRVQKFDSSGVWQMTLGTTGQCGSDNNHFCEPWGVAVDPSGNIYVAEKFNPRVQVFHSSGAYLGTIGGAWGSQDGQFRELYGLDVDAQGDVYVADLFNYRIEKYFAGVAIYLPLSLRDYP